MSTQISATPFTVTTTVSDTTPNQFTFADVSGVALNSVQTSAAITVSGINAASPITVVGGTYSKNGGAFTSAAGTVVNGDTVRAQHTASGSNSTSVNTTVTIGGVSDTFTSTTLAASGIPAHIQSAVAGNWTAIGTNVLRSVANPIQSQWIYTNVGGLMWAWCGAAYDYVRHRMLFSGGGHVDYDGNEIYAFRLDLNSWTRLTNASNYNDQSGSQPPPGGFYPDGGPEATHTYAALQIQPSTGKYFRLLGGGAGFPYAIVWTPTNDSYPPVQGPGAGWAVGGTWPAGTNTIGGGTCYDSVGDRFYVYCLTSFYGDQFLRYDPNNNGYVLAGSGQQNGGGYFTCACDISRRLVVGIGGDSPNNVGSVAIYNITTGATTRQATTGPWPFSGGGQLVFDTRRNIFWFCSVDGRNLWSLNPATWQWTAVTVGGVVPISAYGGGGSNPWGVFGKFQYCHDYDVFLMAPTVDAPVYLYKPVGWSP